VPSRPHPRQPSIRRTVERRTAPLLLYVHALPRWVPFTVVLGLLLAGALLDGLAAAGCLLVVVGFFGWLLYLSWPLLTPGPRLIRGLAIGLLLIAAVVRASGG
jgi:hypothetical protein